MPCNPGAHPSCRHASPPCSPCTHACRAARLSPDNLAAVSAHQHIHVRIGLHLPLMQSRRPPPQAGRLLSFLDSVLCCPLISPPKAALAVTAAADILARRWRPTACFLDTVSIAVVLHGLLFRFLRHQVLAFVDTGEISCMLYSRLRSKTSEVDRQRSTYARPCPRIRVVQAHAKALVQIKTAGAFTSATSAMYEARSNLINVDALVHGLESCQANGRPIHPRPHQIVRGYQSNTLHERARRVEYGGGGCHHDRLFLLSPIIF
jgi:hypothetical protein